MEERVDGWTDGWTDRRTRERVCMINNWTVKANRLSDANAEPCGFSGTSTESLSESHTYMWRAVVYRFLCVAL